MGRVFCIVFFRIMGSVVRAYHQIPHHHPSIALTSFSYELNAIPFLSMIQRVEYPFQSLVRIRL